MNKPNAYQGNEPFIFISYAHADCNLVYPVINRLQQDCFRVWYDEGIEAGSSWSDNIAMHINNCCCFLAFISYSYLKSEYCQDEWHYARNQGRKMILIYLEAVKLPSGMEMLQTRHQSIPWDSFRNEEAFF